MLKKCRLFVFAQNTSHYRVYFRTKSKKDSNKRKHAALQSSDANENIDNEDALALQQIRADEYAPFNRLTVLNAVGTVSQSYLATYISYSILGFCDCFKAFQR